MAQRLTQITGAILAGGRGTRMGGQDKGLLPLNGQPLWRHIYRQLAPQVGNVVISANRNLDHYNLFGLPVISDLIEGFPGPLAGMLSVMEACQNEWYLFCSCDTPQIPDNLATALWAYYKKAPVIWINDGMRDHPTLALMHKSLTLPIREYLQRGERRVLLFFKEAGGQALQIDSAVVNINTPEDLIQWENRQPK